MANEYDESSEATQNFLALVKDGRFHLVEMVTGKSEDASIDNSSNFEIGENKVNDNFELISVEPLIQTYKLPKEKKVSSREWTCDICSKSFASSSAHKSHRRIHTGEKPYGCPEQMCDKRFKTSSDLQKHIRTHTGERPFVCAICQKAFTTSNIRKVHYRVHTGEKPYSCPHEGCSRQFASATNYRNHLRIHTGEKPYVCSFENCTKRFAEYSSLHKHFLVHLRLKKYQCSICQKSYRQMSSLTVHRRTAHKVVDIAKEDEFLYSKKEDCHLDQSQVYLNQETLNCYEDLENNTSLIIAMENVDSALFPNVISQSVIEEEPTKESCQAPTLIESQFMTVHAYIKEPDLAQDIALA